MHAPTPDELTHVVSKVSGLLFDRLASAGLQPSLKAGKTEALVDYKGCGTLQARRELLWGESTTRPACAFWASTFCHYEFQITDLWKQRHGASDQSSFPWQPCI